MEMVFPTSPPYLITVTERPAFTCLSPMVGSLFIKVITVGGRERTFRLPQLNMRRWGSLTEILEMILRSSMTAVAGRLQFWCSFPRVIVLPGPCGGLQAGI